MKQQILWVVALALCSCGPNYRPDEHEWKIVQKNQYGDGAWYFIHEQNNDGFWIKSKDTSYQVGDVLNVCKRERESK